MKQSRYNGIYHSQLKSSATVVGLVLLLVILLNIAIASFLSYRSWSGLRFSENQLMEQREQLQAVKVKPLVKQAEDEEIKQLLAAVPLELMLSDIVKVVKATAAENRVLFMRLAQEKNEGFPQISQASPQAADEPIQASDPAVSSTLNPSNAQSYSFSATFYGEMSDLVRFVQAMYKAKRLFTFDTINMTKLDLTSDIDVNTMLQKMPEWRNGQMVYSLELVFHAFTLPAAFEQELIKKDGKVAIGQ
ncbi:MAG: hypothetical protein H7X86_07430 [Gorillibacterium sp.]|nr:hypothetical protein [Gorillibacterium sp.]